MAYWDWWHLGSTGTQVQPLARHSELRIRQDLISVSGTPYAAGRPKKKKKGKKNRQKSVNKTFLHRLSKDTNLLK